MDVDEAATLLGETELFEPLQRTALVRLAEMATQRSYRKGEFVFSQGDLGDSLFVLLEGVVKVLVVSEQGEQMVLVTLSPPATFGELALVDGRPRSASVEVLEHAEVLVLSQAGFADLIREHPGVTQGLLLSLGSLLRRLTDQTSDFVFLDLHGRVAKMLVGFAEAHGETSENGIVLDLHVTQSDLARMVGGSRQRVNQILGRFEHRGFLEVHGRQIVIKELDLLRRRAGL